MPFDSTGKITLDHIYTQPDPRAYFSTLRGLEYNIPELAKPHFAELVRQRKLARPGKAVQVLDIGCSYGINAALLNGDATMEQLYRRYADPAVAALDRTALLARDRKLITRRPGRTRVVGLDSSRPALDYARAAGMLDDAVCADLESNELTESQRAQLAGTDLVISTGCIGYVGAGTISQVAAVDGDHRPWMAHFVLRMVPFDSIEESLRGLGYDIVRVDQLFRQRRFVSAEEQEQVLDTLRTVGVDPHGWEDTGWLYAQLHLCRPRTLTPATGHVADQHQGQG